jgi:hypothetical protein
MIPCFIFAVLAADFATPQPRAFQVLSFSAAAAVGAFFKQQSRIVFRGRV